jgi:hypothetical protein
VTLCSQAKSRSFSDEGFLLPGIRILGAGRERFCGSFGSGDAFAIALPTLLWAAGEALGDIDISRAPLRILAAGDDCELRTLVAG